ncbi:hypothetical protein GYB59_00965 [bacterium]|nr:hypothetical protein [bacterium]
MLQNSLFSLISFSRGFVSLLLVTAVCLLSGCNSETPPTDDVLDESWFTLEEDGDSPEPAADAPADPAVSKARLTVNLQPGAKFPLRKTVEKTLTQSTLQGPVETTERIELFMSVTLEEVQDQNKKFRILYNRVKYESNMNGQRVLFDSTQPAGNVPTQALAYRGMVNNGFSFWVGADNKITEVVDFNSFLSGCLAHVPSHLADSVSQSLAHYSGQEGIANFVDDTIGLLPYDPQSPDGSSVVRLGGHWSKSKHFNDPVPMSLHSKYTLRELTDKYAKVEVMGDIVPAAAVSNPEQEVSLQIQSGHSIGTCTIDRETGLPLDSHMDHQLSMSVQLNGMQFDQQKRVVTTVKMYPEQSADTPSTITAGQQQNGGLTLTPASQTRPSGP